MGEESGTERVVKPHRGGSGDAMQLCGKDKSIPSGEPGRSGGMLENPAALANHALNLQHPALREPRDQVSLNKVDRI